MQDAAALEDEEKILVDQLKEIHFDQSQETQRSPGDSIREEPNDQFKLLRRLFTMIVSAVDVKLQLLQMSNKPKTLWTLINHKKVLMKYDYTLYWMHAQLNTVLH